MAESMISLSNASSLSSFPSFTHFSHRSLSSSRTLEVHPDLARMAERKESMLRVEEESELAGDGLRGKEGGRGGSSGSGRQAPGSRPCFTF